jgi:2-oxoglutarate dehydrogenase E2 component (dihydrolipoamide succinyltransferase)
MKQEIKVPPMGESIVRAVVGAVLKPPGSQVVVDEEIFEIETDKVNQVIYASHSGFFVPTVSAGEMVLIGQVMGYIDVEANSSAASTKEQKPVKKQSEAPTPEKKELPAPTPPPTIATSPQKAEGSPKVQKGNTRMTKELFLAGIKDQEKLEALKSEMKPETQPSAQEIPPSPSEAPDSSSPRETRRRMSNIRKLIGERMLKAQTSTAMLTTFNEVDLSQIISLRDNYKDDFQKQYGVKLGFMPFFVKAVVSGLKHVPDLNSFIDWEDIVHREYYDIGIAVGTDRGVMVPVLRDCDRLSFPDIEKALSQFATKAREGNIAVNDLQGGGFTITNGGVYGSMLSTPMLIPPQCGILGMHKITKRAVVVDDQIVIRPVMYLALSYDHRVVDGKEAVSFLVHVKNCLEDPARFVLDI